MSKSTITKPITLLHFMYTYAMKKNYVEKDLSQFIIKVSENDKVSMHKSLTPEEILLVKSDADSGIEDAMRLMIYIYTGFRATELLEVKKENVHLDDKYIIGGKKTAAGLNRTVPIHNSIVKYVRYFYNRSNVYLFEERDRPFTYHHFKDYNVNPYFESKEMNHTMHDTRHTCATLLKKYKCDELCRKLILGHAVTDLTDRVYTHITVEELIMEMNKIDLK